MWMQRIEKNVFSQKTQWVGGGGEAEDDQEDGRAWATSLQLDEESWQAKKRSRPQIFTRRQRPQFLQITRLALKSTTFV